MGNCQAVDAAALVIQHPCGKVDRLYWPVGAGEIMKKNPGHYVALLVSTTTLSSPPNGNEKNQNNNQVRFTRIKLLRPTDTLVLGQVYRLITAQELMKGLKAKKQAKMSKYHLESGDRAERFEGKLGLGTEKLGGKSKTEESQVTRAERHRTRVNAGSANSAMARSRTWQPSLQSISEAGS